MTRRVLVVRADSLGDVLLTGPAVRAVAAAGANVTMLCSPTGAPAARILPGLDDVVVARLPWIDPDPEPVDRAWIDAIVDEIAGRAFDQAIVFTSFHQSPLPFALLARMAGIPVVAAISIDYPGSLLDVRHRVPEDIHEVERALSLVATLGYTLPETDDGRLRVRRARRPAYVELQVDPGYVVVHPGASVPARAWEPDRLVALVDALVAEGRRVVVTGGRAERGLTARVTSGPRPGVRDLGGADELPELVEVIANAAAVITGNTGPAHVAAAVATPVVSLYAPTVPASRWRPWRVPHVLLGEQEIECAGCRARTCPRPGHPCLGGISVEDVLDALDALAPLDAPPRGAEVSVP